MGETFVNVHIRAERSNGKAFQARVAAALRARVASGPWREVAAEGEGDRTVRVAPAEAGWLSVYDDELEVSEELAPLCVDLSRAMATWVVGAEVFDSDYLYLVLARNGSVVDEFHSMPGYGEPVSDETRRALAGRSERWQPLVSGGDSTALRETWDAHESRADEKMAQVARILGIPARRALVGSGQPDWIYDADSVRLRFESTAPPLAQEDLPALQAAGSRGPSTVPVGSDIDVDVRVRSVGQAGTGLIALISGDVLEMRLLELESVRAASFDSTDYSTDGSTDEKTQRLSAAELLPGGPGNETGRAANFADLQIPAGASQADAPSMQLHIRGRTLQAGSGTLEVMVFPVDNFGFGWAQFSIPVSVAAP